MDELKSSIKASLSSDLERESLKAEKKQEPIIEKVKVVKKKRVGRPSKQNIETKLNNILIKRGMTRKDLYLLIAEKYPDEPISPDAVSRIVNGSRVYYSTTTLFRICGALNITPNMALDYERHI